MSENDHDILLQLNIDYINSVQHSDINRFDEILAEDFRCSNSDGSIVDRAAFLNQTKNPAKFSELNVEDVEIRIIGACGIIHAKTVYKDEEGNEKTGRYTDVWIKQEDNNWLAVCAHVMRN
ncbi:MAG: DUF4440 domain-containing protein [SAR86 cluster bacterium]|uniref:DUF4440 domain-containing protein n=1 Tax=SAR86 cluster bacterium TaxID=2030880 RepID=A0A2A5B7F4_9GAMM|nr:MAG: DUF4440 domain-containing protein [SAR86 cluster bacterium]